MTNSGLGEKWVAVDGSLFKVEVTAVDNPGRDEVGEERARISYYVLGEGGRRDSGSLTTIVLDRGMTHSKLPEDVVKDAIAQQIRHAMTGGDLD